MLCTSKKFTIYMHQRRPRTPRHCQYQNCLLQCLHCWCLLKVTSLILVFCIQVSCAFWSTLLICSINKRIKNIYIDKELVLPMYNVHPYFSLKNLGKKVHIIHGKNVVLPNSFSTASIIIWPALST